VGEGALVMAADVRVLILGGNYSQVVPTDPPIKHRGASIGRLAAKLRIEENNRMKGGPGSRTRRQKLDLSLLMKNQSGQASERTGVATAQSSVPGRPQHTYCSFSLDSRNSCASNTTQTCATFVACGRYTSGYASILLLLQ
jgi:hypothetical protein